MEQRSVNRFERQFDRRQARVIRAWTKQQRAAFALEVKRERIIAITSQVNTLLRKLDATREAERKLVKRYEQAQAKYDDACVEFDAARSRS